jgi:hypothetical protein
MFLEDEKNIPVDYPPWKGCRILGDVIKEVDIRTHEVIWEWHLHQYVDPVEHHREDLCTGIGDLMNGDWSHCNTVKYYQNYFFNGESHDVVLLNSRHLDTFWIIDYETSEILWSCGQHGTIGRKEPPAEPLFSHAHEVELLEDGNFLMFDNGNFRDPQVSRALEIQVDPTAGTAMEVWSWTEPLEVMYSYGMGDANRLPNGNTLVTDPTQGRIIEVTPDGEKVWQLALEYPSGPVWIYKFERVDPWPPCLDSDADGYGDPACLTCPNWGHDCDDLNPAIHSGAREGPYGDDTCSDTLDNDCDGDPDDLDSGCYECFVPAECGDSNPCTDDDCVDGFCIHTNNTDPCDDNDLCTEEDRCMEGICVGSPLDADDDGYVSDVCGGDDCDDSNLNINPGVPEICNELDDDCSGTADDRDHDGDGYIDEACGGGDCNDTNPNIYATNSNDYCNCEEPIPDGTAESTAARNCADGIDNDCDGWVDTDPECEGYSATANAEASTHGSNSLTVSGVVNGLALLLVPVGVVLFLRILRRKK